MSYDKSANAFIKKLDCLDKKCLKEIKAIEHAKKKNELELEPLRQKLIAEKDKLKKNKLQEQMWKIHDKVKTGSLNKCMIKKCYKEARNNLSLEHDLYKKNCKDGIKADCKLAKDSQKLLKHKNISDKEYGEFAHKITLYIRDIMRKQYNKN